VSWKYEEGKSLIHNQGYMYVKLGYPDYIITSLFRRCVPNELSIYGAVTYVRIPLIWMEISIING
jgi:hypothetical protein